MATFKLVMPKMGESVQEATITKWFKKAGDVVEEDDILLEIATDKVDSEIPSPVAGKIDKILFEEGTLVAVGEVIAIIDLDGKGSTAEKSVSSASPKDEKKSRETIAKEVRTVSNNTELQRQDRFYSPLVRNIASSENINIEELENIAGTGLEGRVKKQDILNYIKG